MDYKAKRESVLIDFALVLRSWSCFLFFLAASLAQAQVLDPDEVFGIETFKWDAPAAQKVFQKKHLSLELISGVDFAKKTFAKISSEYPNQSCTVGMNESFYVRNVLNTDEWLSIEAVCIYLSNSYALWIETGWSNPNYNHTDVLKALETISVYLDSGASEYSVQPGNGVLDIVKTYYGKPPNIRGDGVVDIIFLDIKDFFENTGSYIAGFFDPVNLFEHPFSNQRDLIYVDIYPTLVYNNEFRIEETSATIVHEYQHLVFANYSKGRNRSIFINEGLSELAEILVGFEPRSADHYLADTERALLEWRSEKPLPDYARGSLFLHYFFEQAGFERIYRLVQSEKDGIDAFSDALWNTGISFDDMFLDWGKALFYNDLTLNSAWGYQHPKRQGLKFRSAQTIQSFPGILNINLPAYSHRLIDFPLTSKVSLTSGKNLPWYFSAKSMYPDGSIQTSPSHNLMSYAYADQSEYGSVYLLASNPESLEDETAFIATGKKSGIEKTLAYDNGIPDVFIGNASYLLLNGSVHEVAIRFEPGERAWLNGISIKAVFLSEVMGSQIPSNTPRRIQIAIKSIDDDGLPGTPLIPEFEWNFQRPFGNLRFETIPLIAYYEAISQILDPFFVVISNADESPNPVALAMNRSGKNNSWFRRNGTTEWNWFSEVLSGMVSGWNPMVRAEMVERLNYQPSLQLPSFEINFDFTGVTVSIPNDWGLQPDDIRLVARMPSGKAAYGILQNPEIFDRTFLFDFPVEVGPVYHFYLTKKLPDGKTVYSNEWSWEIDVKDGFILNQNYPNPFNPRTNLPMLLLESARVNIRIYDVLGRVVRQYDEATLEPGHHVKELDFSTLASGIYFINVSIQNQKGEQKVTRNIKVSLIK